MPFNPPPGAKIVLIAGSASLALSFTVAGAATSGAGGHFVMLGFTALVAGAAWHCRERSIEASGHAQYTPVYSMSLYNANTGSDRDKDGIACEA